VLNKLASAGREELLSIGPILADSIQKLIHETERRGPDGARRVSGGNKK